MQKKNQKINLDTQHNEHMQYAQRIKLMKTVEKRQTVVYPQITLKNKYLGVNI